MRVQYDSRGQWLHNEILAALDGPWQSNLQVCLGGRGFVLVVVEGTALVLVAAIAVDENVATKRILVLYGLAVSGEGSNETGDHRPRPLDLGEPT